jgi:MYXO-CTERM domain-containing protein
VVAARNLLHAKAMLGRLALIATLLTSMGTALASSIESITIEGVVVESRPAWTSNHEEIATYSTIRTSSGDVTVMQLGGSVDGIGMRMFPGPPVIELGARVAVTARASLDLAQRTHLVVSKVRTLSPSSTFVRTGPTERGNPLFWESGCVTLVPDVSNLRAITAEQALQAIDAAVAEWNDRTSDCSYIHLAVTAPVAGETAVDKINRIKFREDKFCRPATMDLPEVCTDDPGTLAITFSKFVDDPSSGRDGAILDADIELNGTGGFELGVDGPQPGKCIVDVQATLTHEIGHLLGLGHACINDEKDRQPFDNEGNPVPACLGLDRDPPEIAERTMYNFQGCGEQRKATLTDDDVAGICAIYPRGDEAPVTCTVSGTAVEANRTGCSTGGGSGGAVLLIAFALVRRARRRQPRTIVPD